MLRNESKIHYDGSCDSTICIACSRDISGGYSDGVPPLPIPNREVKPDRADGTAHPRESRSPPFYESPEFNMNSGLSFCIYDLTGLSQFQHLIALSRLFLLHILAFSRISITFASSNSRGASKQAEFSETNCL